MDDEKNYNENIDDIKELEANERKDHEERKKTNNKEEPKPVISLEGKTVYRVKVVHSNATEFCINESPVKVEKDDYVIFPTKYGRDLGHIQGEVKNLTEVGQDEVVVITRKAGSRDLKRYEENKKKDKKAFDICKEKSREHKLDMKLVSAHYLLDESKILFFFTADARVDFRELVKDLVSIFRTRIELRQIGVRDESRVLGGMGMCGRGFCCNTITDKLNPVSIKMAKEQNLSLNSLKISGACGRLLCCLSYEYPFYQNEKKKLPPQGYRMKLKGNEYYVHEINIFEKKVVLKCSGDVIDMPFENFYYDDQTSAWCLKR